MSARNGALCFYQRGDMSEIVMSKRVQFKYVTHTIRMYGVNPVPEDQEKCSEELTALFADGWQKQDHQVKVKRTKVVHAWILTRVEPEKIVVFEAPKVATDAEENEATDDVSDDIEEVDAPPAESKIVFHFANTADEPEETEFEKAMKAGKTVAEVIALGNKLAYDASMRVVRERLIFSPIRNSA